MDPMKATIRGVLEGDATLMALLTGGVYDASEMGREGLDLSLVQDTNGRIKPHAILRWRGGNPFGLEVLPAESTSLEIYVYQHRGYTAIDSAIARIKGLLHRKYFRSTDTGLLYLTWAGDLGEQTADEEGGAAMSRSRYQTIYTRG